MHSIEQMKIITLNLRTMKQISKLTITLLLLMAGVIDVAAQNPFDVNTTVENVKVVSQPSTGDIGLVFKYGGLHYKILSEKTVEVTGDVRSVCKGRVEIPNIVKYKNKTYTVVGIGSAAFSGQSGMTAVVIPKTIQYIENQAFASTGMTDVIIPGDNVTVKKQAFFNCQSLSVVTLSGKDPICPDKAFEKCPKLKELRIRGNNPQINGKKFGNTSAVFRVL